LSLEVVGDIAKLMGLPKGDELAVADFVAPLRRAPGMLEEMDEPADPVGTGTGTRFFGENTLKKDL
jgi:hypothetical protein